MGAPRGGQERYNKKSGQYNKLYRPLFYFLIEKTN